MAQKVLSGELTLVVTMGTGSLSSSVITKRKRGGFKWKDSSYSFFNSFIEGGQIEGLRAILRRVNS
ncbi:hypothetical protein LG298_07445 [Cytobacillus firmus]|uniref:hypothetical protein n=1 Tax=Cytobacillus firmus TaxID=1399 RepID=UPI00384CA1F0